MNAGILAALVAAASALVVALISAVAAIVTSKSSGRVTKELELLKHNLRKKDEEQLKLKESREKQIGALRECIRALQMAKDELKLIQTHYPDALDDEEAQKRATAARDGVLETNQKFQEELRDQRKLFHEAKNLIFEADKWYSDQDRTHVVWLKLNDLQGRLRDVLAGVMVDGI